MGSLLAALAAAVVAAGLTAWALALRRRTKTRRLARELASELVPEIRAILSDPASLAASTDRFQSHRGGLREALPRDASFAVETFYQSAAALEAASLAMRAAFSDESEASLGDRIRAKDLRDRCENDVYYAGEAAIEKLESSS